jgi:hypothetical protein
VREEAIFLLFFSLISWLARIMEAVLHSQFHGKIQSVNPGQVKRFLRVIYPDDCPTHKTGKKSRSIDYRLGKKMAINITRRLLPEQDAKWQMLFEESKKKDDFADSFLQAVYYQEKIWEKD